MVSAAADGRTIGCSPAQRHDGLAQGAPRRLARRASRSAACSALVVALGVTVTLTATPSVSRAGSATAAKPTPTKLMDALRLVADTPEHRGWIVLTDHAAVRRAAGKTKTVDALLAMIRNRVQIPAPMQIERSPEVSVANLALLGVNLDLITASVQAGQPPDMIDAVVGPIVKKSVAARVAACGAKCPVAPTTRTVGRATMYAYSEDPLKVDIARRHAPPAFDELGRGPILTVGDGYLARSYSNASADGVANARGGKGSLADVSDFREATTALERMGIMSAILIAEPLVQGPDPRNPGASPGTLLQPYLLLAVGSGVDASGPLLGIAIVNVTAAAAKQNAELLRTHLTNDADPLTSRPWKDLLSIVDLQAKGRVVVGTFRGSAAGQFMTVVNGRGLAPVG